MARKRQIMLANLVIRYGAKMLLDELKDSIWPAIKTAKIQARGETEAYLFHEMSVGFLEEGAVPVLFGRLVARKSLESEQVLDERTNTLRGSRHTLDSAPSALFVLTLADHKLAFLRETRRSPSLKDFEYCLKKCLERDWHLKYSAARRIWLREHRLKRVPAARRREFESWLSEQHPRPEVRVTPLPAIKDVDKHFRAYKVLTQLTLTPLKTNDEFPDQNDEFIHNLTKTKERMNSDKTKIGLANAEEGLNKSEAEKLVRAASNGNYEVKLKGRDEQNHEIDGDLESLGIKLEIELPDERSGEKQEPASSRSVKVYSLMKKAFGTMLVAAIEAQETQLKKARSAANKILEELS